jgi:hypothetical protein
MAVPSCMALQPTRAWTAPTLRWPPNPSLPSFSTVWVVCVPYLSGSLSQISSRVYQFGWVGPNGQQNLGALDIIASMTFLNNVLPTFGGVANKITLAGQSSGATIIRALLAAPSVTQLFQSAILQSDPMVGVIDFTQGLNRLTHIL